MHCWQSWTVCSWRDELRMLMAFHLASSPARLKPRFVAGHHLLLIVIVLDRSATIAVDSMPVRGLALAREILVIHCVPAAPFPKPTPWWSPTCSEGYIQSCKVSKECDNVAYAIRISRHVYTSPDWVRLNEVNPRTDWGVYPDHAGLVEFCNNNMKPSLAGYLDRISFVCCQDHSMFGGRGFSHSPPSACLASGLSQREPERLGRGRQQACCFDVLL